VTACLFSKYVWVRPLRNATSNLVLNHPENDVFLRFGAPKILLSDNGTQFHSKVVEECCKNYGVDQWFTYKWHPEANPTERINRVVKGMIKSYIEENQRHWDRELARINAAINSAVHDITGFSPHYLMFGEQLKLHGGLRDLDVEDGSIPLISARDRKIGLGSAEMHI